MDGPSKVTLVYFIGGCTHAEISALRFLARQENSEYIRPPLSSLPPETLEKTEHRFWHWDFWDRLGNHFDL